MSWLLDVVTETMLSKSYGS